MNTDELYEELNRQLKERYVQRAMKRLLLGKPYPTCNGSQVLPSGNFCHGCVNCL